MQTGHGDIAKLPRIDGAAVAIIRSSRSIEVVDALTGACVNVLLSLGAHIPEQHTIPGSLELPLATQCLIESRRDPLDAVICFGVVLQGETLHFEMVSHAVTQGLLQVSLQTRTPIFNEVLAVARIEDARDRALDNEFNKGIEAAAAAAELIAWRRTLG